MGALSNVKLCEKNPLETFETNVNGTINIVQAANIINAKVIFISSLASINPISEYGKSKYMSEEIIKTVTEGYEILQLSMTFGLSPNTKNHRPFNKIIKTKISGIPNTYDNTWKFQPTHLKHVFLVINRIIIEDTFLGRTIPVITKECTTMYKLITDILGNNNILKGNSYSNRKEHVFGLNKLLDSNLPMCCYKLMIRDLKEDIRVYQLMIANKSDDRK